MDRHHPPERVEPLKSPEPESGAGRPEQGVSPRPITDLSVRRLRGGRAWALAALRTTPVRVWTLSFLCVVAIVGLFAASAVTLDRARGSLSLLGEEAGPQAMATTELYLSLAGMDACVADLLLMGTDEALQPQREGALKQYEANREEAGDAILEAALLAESKTSDEATPEAEASASATHETEGTGEAGGDVTRAEAGADEGTNDDDENVGSENEGGTTQDHNIRAVLDRMGAYERLVGEALRLNEMAGAAPGEVDPEALAAYRQATRVMHEELLPKAFNLGLESSAIVRVDHEEGRTSMLLGQVWVGAGGIAALVLLVGLQVYLRARFRRLLNIPLLIASAGTILLAVGVVWTLGSGSEQQRIAKEEGLEEVMALARAGAVSMDMQADQSRYLIDVERADNHQQVYLERSQQVLFRPADTLEDYYERVGEVAEAFPEPPEELEGLQNDPGALGYLGRGDEERSSAAQEARLARVLDAYDDLQAEDREMREAMRDGDLEKAIEIRLGVIGPKERPGETDPEEGAFQSYTVALDGLIAEHREKRFDAAIARGEARVAPWVWGLPVGSVALLALVVAGVRPRLAEYR
ncbi:hypothetical protein [Nocardiopsis alba]|uniref:hypothetical protein n=1 Tax=Nocardiopsis alba TaxID=53437 RepID=UPI003F4D48FA